VSSPSTIVSVYSEPLRKIAHTLIDRAARSYVAGPHLSDAIDFAWQLEQQGMSSTIAYWNNIGDDPADVYGEYLSAIDGAADAGLHTYISIKAPALSMSESFAETLARRCRDRHIGLHFDSLAIDHQRRTFDLIERLGSIGANLGCTLPGRSGRSQRYVERAVAQRLRVRVVKGQWEDPGYAIDAHLGFMTLINRLAGRAAHVAVATHEPKLAEEALARLKDRATPAELELLLGLPMQAVKDVARRFNVPVRIYIPYGHAWLPYEYSAARKNPRVLRWLLLDALHGAPPRHHYLLRSIHSCAGSFRNIHLRTGPAMTLR
jgi:proline dehydrogenase